MSCILLRIAGGVDLHMDDSVNEILFIDVATSRGRGEGGRGGGMKIIQN